MSSPTRPARGDVFDVRRIRRLVELMNEHDLSEIDLREGETRIRLRRGPDDVITTVAAACRRRPCPPRPPAAQRPTPLRLRGGDAKLTVIKSPMVGTFYTAPTPSRRRSSRSATTSAPRRTVCIIEAMKVFNEIPAEVSGKIVGRAGRERRAGRVRPAAVPGRRGEVSSAAAISDQSQI